MSWSLQTSAVALAIGAFAVAATPAAAKVEGEVIVLGSAISLTGKYSTNGIHAQNGYDLAVQKINEMGGVTVAKSSTMMMSQHPPVARSSPSA